MALNVKNKFVEINNNEESKQEKRKIKIKSQNIIA